MEKPDDKTTINVKGMPKAAWEEAKKGSTRTGEPMGAWLAGAIQARLDQESGSVKPGNPTLTPDQITARMTALAALQQSAAALKQAKVRSKSIALSTSQESLAGAIMDAEGRAPRLIEAERTVKNGINRSISGQSGRLIDATLPPPDSPS